jgi:hypothetical protein
MGRCLCLPSLRNLLRSLLPVLSLNIKIPAIMANLVAMSNNSPAVSGASSMSAEMMAAIRWAIGLPPIPINLHLAMQIAATATAAEQIQASLGANVYNSSSWSILANILASIRLNLPLALAAFPSVKSGIFPMISLTSALATIAQFRAAFGIDLLAPTAALQLRALIAEAVTLGNNPPGPTAVSASVCENVSAYMSLAASANLMGGLPNLMPNLALLSQIQIPPINGQLMFDLANLFTLQQAAWNIQSILGIDPFAINAMAQIQLALQPLQLLEQLNLQPGQWPAPPSFSFLPPISASMMAQIQALASMNLQLLANLKLPNLTPLALVATINQQYPCTTPC